MSTLAMAGCQTGAEYQAPYVFQSDCEEAREQNVLPLTFVVDKNASQARVNGEICTGSYQAFQSMIEFYPDIKLLRLQDVPGSMDDKTNALLMGKIHDMGINTLLESSSTVTSGGTDLFLSGVERRVEKGAQIGVHSWADEDDQGQVIEGAELPAESAVHQSYIDLYKQIGLEKPEEFYWFTMYSAASDEIHFLSDDELEYFGVSTPKFSF